MLKIKDNVDLKELEKYGFKKEPEKSYYYKSCSEGELFIWITRGEKYKPRHIYFESENYTMILTELDELYNLIKADLVEKVESDE